MLALSDEKEVVPTRFTEHMHLKLPLFRSHLLDVASGVYVLASCGPCSARCNRAVLLLAVYKWHLGAWPR